MPPSITTKSFIPFIQRVAGCAVLMGFAGLFLTAYPAFWGEAGLSGYRHFLHAGMAPVFAVCITFLALARAPRHAECSSGSILWHGCFWLILIAAVPLILSSVLAMFAIYGTQAQRLLLRIHRGSAVFFSAFIVLYALLPLGRRPGESDSRFRVE
ncbi:MAG TPA: hypothetical protein PK878_17670 [bacterium]|nr:hypothetical protein [bacterium]HPP01814.1 hypothetical protein [bacterium]HXK95430.1 hypothetical protein [bacterium]